MWKRKEEIISGETITDEAAKYLNISARWSRYISVIGFVFFIIILIITVAVIVLLFTGEERETLPQIHSFTSSQSSWIYIISYSFFLFIYAVPLYFLYEYSVRIKKALKSGDSPVLTKAFKSLKNHFMLIGLPLTIGLFVFKLASAIIVLGLAVGNN